jgi:hypothetical protein
VNNPLDSLEGIYKKIVPEHVRPNAVSLLKWVLLGYIIRSVVAPLLVSTDYVVVLWRTYGLIQTHGLVPMGDPPLVSIIIAPFLIMFSSQATGMFGDVVSNTRFSPFASSIPVRLSGDGATTLLYATKIPNIIMDISLAFLLLHLIKDPKKAQLAFKLWLLNPITIFISFAVGQYDIFPVFFLMLSLYFLKTGRANYSAISLGVASAFKWFAFPFLIPFALILARQQPNGHKRKITFAKVCVIGIIPILISVASSLIIPTYYEPINAAYPNFEFYNGFFGSKLSIPWLGISNPLLANLLIFAVDFGAKITLYPPVELYILFLFYGLFLSACIYFKRWNYSVLWKAMLAFFMLYYAFSHFHVQWFLWGLPFLTIFMVEEKRFLKMLPFFITLYFVYILYWDASLTSNLLVPIISQAWYWSGPVSLANGFGFPAIELLNMFRSLFSALLIFTAIVVLMNIYKEFKGGDTGEKVSNSLPIEPSEA